MTNPLDLILQQSGQGNNPFSPASRYAALSIATLETEDGPPISYVRRRIIPPPEQFQLLHEHTVSEAERPDHIAQQYLGDPEQFWRVCDANAVMAPNELTDTLDRKVKITLPEGIPGQR